MAVQTIRLLVVDRETLISRRIKEFMAANGIDCELVTHGKDLIKTITAWRPNYILIDLVFADYPALNLMKDMKADPLISKMNIGVMVTSSHNSAKNVQTAFGAGACDYIVKPFKVEDILSRIVFQMQKSPPPPEVEDLNIHALEGAALYLHLLELIMKEAISVRNPREKLFGLMQMLSMSMKAVRCSIIKTDIIRFEGIVLASSDDIRVKKIDIDLSKYPEVIHTVNTQKTTCIEDIGFNPELARLKKVVKTISFNSIIVTPIFVNGEVFGVVSARMDAKQQKFTVLQIRFCQLIAHVSSMVLNSVEYFPYLEQKKPGNNSAA
jgi:DNA-binding response OmpR family regulator